MKRLPSRFILVPIAVAAIALAGCSGSSATSAVHKVDATEAVGMLDARVVVDVRTAAEYAAGHIAGARNIDVEAADFPSRISTLDRAGAYLVYCQSGRRSAIAAQQMAEAGFSDIVDAGALAELASAGAPVE